MLLLFLVLGLGFPLGSFDDSLLGWHGSDGKRFVFSKNILDTINSLSFNMLKFLSKTNTLKRLDGHNLLVF